MEITQRRLNNVEAEAARLATTSRHVRTLRRKGLPLLSTASMRQLLTRSHRRELLRSTVGLFPPCSPTAESRPSAQTS